MGLSSNYDLSTLRTDIWRCGAGTTCFDGGEIANHVTSMEGWRYVISFADSRLIANLTQMLTLRYLRHERLHVWIGISKVRRCAGSVWTPSSRSGKARFIHEFMNYDHA